MAQIPKLSSSRPLATPQLKGTLSLPTNFPTPVSNNGAAGAFAALAQTAGNIADFKQHLFDREQAAYEERAYGEARIKAQVFLNETSQAVSQSITKENYRYKDGDAPVRTGMEGRFKDPSFYDSIEGYSPLTPRNQEIVRNKINNEYLVRAAQLDESYRTAGRKLTEQTNYDNNRLVIATVSPEVSLNEDGGINFSKDYVTALKKAFVHADQYNLDKDKIGSDFVLKLVTPENIEIALKNPGFAKALVAEAKSVMSDSSGQSFVNTPVLAGLDRFNKLVTTEKNKTAAALASERESRFRSNASDTKLPETISDFPNRLIRYQQILEQAQSLVANYPIGNETKNVIIELENNYEALVRVHEFVFQENPIFPKGTEDEEELNEVLKNASILGRATSAAAYYKNLEGLSVEDDNKRNSVVKLLGDLIKNTNAQSHLKVATTYDATSENTSVLKMLQVSQEAYSLEPRYDSKAIKWPSDLLDNAIANFSYLRNNENFPALNGISEEAVELFKVSVLNNLDDKQKLDAVLISPDLDNKYNPEIFEDLNNVTSESLGFVDSENWAKSIFGPQMGLVLAGSVSKSINIVHARLQNDVEYNDLVVKYNKSDADGKEKLAPELKRRLAKEYAKVIDRTYIEGIGIDGFVMLNKKSFPAEEYGADIIDAGRVLSSNLLFGSGNAGNVIDTILNYPVVPDTDFLVEKTVAEATGKSVPSRLPSSDEMLKMLEEADWSGSHDSVKASFISAAKTGALISGNAIIRKVKQELDALRSSGQIVVDSNGQLHYSYRVGGSGGKVVTTQHQTLSSISAIIGEQGMQNVRLRSRNVFGKLLQLENPLGDPMKSVYDIDVELPYDLQTPEEVKEFSRNFMSRVDWNEAVEIGKNVSANGVVKRLKEGDFSAYKITGDVAAYKDYDKSSAMIARVHGSSPYSNTQNAHILSRMFAPIIDLGANQLDRKINLTPTSIAFNQYTQPTPELEIIKEVEKVIKEGKADGLKAEWDIVTYNPSLGAIEKGGFGDVSEGVSTPMISAMQWRLQFKDENGTVVYNWEYSIEDKEVLNLASRNNLFLEN